jgi:hypothetical protein
LSSRVPLRFPDQTAVILGTGPGLTEDAMSRVAGARRLGRVRVFGMNNTFQHYRGDMDVFTACDPAWWRRYGDDFNIYRSAPRVNTVDGRRERHPLAYHWDANVCRDHDLTYVEGRWGDGLSTNPDYIHYGHSSGYQLINLAVLHGCRRILLCGFDMQYRAGAPRHYFNGLSGDPGEYPAELRKWSTFTGLLACYKTIADQMAVTKAFEIINCTPNSAMSWFPLRPLENYL